MDSNNFDYNNFDFNNTAIIKPPTNHQHKVITTQILIDSRDRDIVKYKNNNQFTITLDQPIKNVTEIEIISANMPNTIYNVNNNNNRIYFKKLSTDDIYYIKLTPGAYEDITDILTRSGFKNNTPTSDIYEFRDDPTTSFSIFNSDDDTVANVSPTFTFDYDIHTHKFNIKITEQPNYYHITTKNIENDNYLKNSAHAILGFDLNYDRDIQTLFTNNENRSNTIVNLEQNDYGLLFLDNLNIYYNKVTNNNLIQNAFAKLHFGQGGTRSIFFGRIKNFTNLYDINPSITLTKLDIKITDYYGNLFDFNNYDFTLTFSVSHTIKNYR